MIKLENYWEQTSPSIKKLILWLKVTIGTISVSAFVKGDPEISFYFLVAGAVIDGLLQLLPSDATIKPGAKAVCCIVGLFVVAASFTGCFSKRSVVEHSVTDTTTTTYKPVDYQYRGAIVVKGLNLDSLFKAALMDKDQRLEDSITNLKIENKYKQDSIAALQAGKPAPPAPVLIKPKPIITYVTDPQTKAQLGYWLDQFGKLQVSCESKDQTLQLMVAQVSRLRTELDKKVTTVFETPEWAWITIGISIFLNILFIGLRVFKTTLKAV